VHLVLVSAGPLSTGDCPQIIDEAGDDDGRARSLHDLPLLAQLDLFALLDCQVDPGDFLEAALLSDPLQHEPHQDGTDKDASSRHVLLPLTSAFVPYAVRDVAREQDGPPEQLPLPTARQVWRTSVYQRLLDMLLPYGLAGGLSGERRLRTLQLVYALLRHLHAGLAFKGLSEHVPAWATQSQRDMLWRLTGHYVYDAVSGFLRASHSGGPAGAVADTDKLAVANMLRWATHPGKREFLEQQVPVPAGEPSWSDLVASALQVV
jgi:hypothetical protein